MNQNLRIRTVSTRHGFDIYVVNMEMQARAKVATIKEGWAAAKGQIDFYSRFFNCPSDGLVDLVDIHNGVKVWNL